MKHRRARARGLRLSGNHGACGAACREQATLPAALVYNWHAMCESAKPGLCFTSGLWVTVCE